MTWDADFEQGGFWLEEEARCELIGNDIFQNQKSGIQARLPSLNLCLGWQRQW